MQGLGDLPRGTYDSVARATSSDGSIVVGVASDENGQVAFIWDVDRGMRNFQDVLETDYGIDLPGWKLAEANSISDDGKTIVGEAIDGGQLRGWIAQLGPRCDFNGNSVCNVSDLNLMSQQGDLVAGIGVTGADEKFDLNSDDTINQQDIDVWLDEAATKNGYPTPFIRGDTDGLDSMSPTPRTVDITDFQNFLNGFTGSCATWECGNFNGDNFVDITDFNAHFLLNFIAITGGATYGQGQSIPEPSTVLLLGLGTALLTHIFRRDSLAM